MAEAVVPTAPRRELLRLDLPKAVETLSFEQRRLGLRIAPYNVVAESRYGPLMFERGAFVVDDPREVRLRMDHEDPPTGTGRSWDPDEALLEFLVSKTQRGTDQLTLVADGTSTGASVGFHEIAPPRIEQVDGRRVRVYPPNSVHLDEVSTTWQPTFKEAGVAYVMNKETPMTETTTVEAPAPTPPTSITMKDVKEEVDRTSGTAVQAMTSAIDRVLAASDERNREMGGKLEAVLSQLGDWQERYEELVRKNFSVPPGEERRKAKLHNWVEVTLRRMAGQTISPQEIKALALDDVVTTEQPGLVPAQFTRDYDDLINQDRPFLQSTRQIAPPATGTSMTLPLIHTRAASGSQAGPAEKGELTTGATKVGTGTFAYKSVFGGADISIQMINRADASFFDLLTGDMAMTYALDCEVHAIESLLAGYTAAPTGSHIPEDGGTLNPEMLELGAAWQTAITVYRRAPDTIWLSAAAVAAFIDAKAPLTNAPLYSNLAAAFTAGTGAGGILSGLRPIYVPALDEIAEVDVIVGPSRGFVWAEDPARTLQADNPAHAGRDIALVGGIFPAPRFADAFTVYAIAGGS